MRIAVIAANGRTGQAFVKAALLHGHQVTAGIHGFNPFEGRADLRTLVCDARDAKQVAALIKNADAVVSLIGHVKGSPPRVQTEAMQTIITAMEQQDARRLISLTGTGVRFAGDQVGIVDRLLNFSIAHIDPQRIQDGIEHVEVLKKSTLDWTVIRVLKLTGGHIKPFSLRAHGPTKWYVGRAEVAEAILQTLETNSFVREAPIICRPE